MYDKLSVITLAKGRMDWVAKRQEVLSENVVNANTPKYVPSDLKPFDFKTVLSQTQQPVQVAVTNTRHVQPAVQDTINVVSQKKAFESSPDGNAVVLDEQLAKIGEAKSAYDMAATLFQKQFKMIKTALGKSM